jgi:DNA-binding response OmpR family regulator
MGLLPRLTHPRPGFQFQYQASQPSVLIVGFDAADRLRVRVTLERAGYCVLSGTVDEAPSILRIILPSVILIDVEPLADPLALVEWLRRTAECRSIPVLAMTGDPELVGQSVGARAGYSGFIPKPLDLRRLGDRVAEFID